MGEALRFLVKRHQNFARKGLWKNHLCYAAFSRAITKINLGIAYATWCGVGILVTTGISFLVFKEELSVFGLVGIFFIVIGCIMVNLTPG